MAEPKRIGVDHLNRTIRAGRHRADGLEPRLANVVEPILKGVADSAAANFTRYASDHHDPAFTPSELALVASLGKDRIRQMFPSLVLSAAGGVTGQSTMVAVKPRPDEAAMLGAEDAEILHVTLAYLGETEGPLEDVAAAVAAVASSHAPLTGRVGGVGSFDDTGHGYPSILLPSVPGLIELRVAVTEALIDAGIDYGRDHGYLPHMTVGYAEGEMELPSRDGVGQELHFDDLWVVRGDVETIQVPFTGDAPLTAAADPPGWVPPSPDEVVDVAALSDKIRTKTDPVRVAMVSTVMKPTLDALGVSFDVTNPFTARALASTGSQITEIAKTTQYDVSKIIQASYLEGLSIPDTAIAIRTRMAEASVARSTLIARTELVGAVNAGSLAATAIVTSETGEQYNKVWLTAPGAKYPRHEDYPGLDGQTVGLAEFFDVGGNELQFPGDPNGDPEEVCNCRCALVYEDGSGDGDTGEPVDDVLLDE